MIFEPTVSLGGIFAVLCSLVTMTVGVLTIRGTLKRGEKERQAALDKRDAVKVTLRELGSKMDRMLEMATRPTRSRSANG